MKKRHLKKIIYIFLITSIVLFLVFIFNNKNKNTKIENNINISSINYVEELLNYNNEDFDEAFLNYIKDNYGEEVLKDILKSLEENKYDKEIWHDLTGNSYIVLMDLYKDSYENNDQVTVVDEKKDNISISFAGDISFADNWEIMPYYKSRNEKIYGVLSEDLVDYMKNMDIMIINNEFCFSNRGEPLETKMYTFRANPDNVSIYEEIGVDMVTLANNHVYDFGTSAFLDTLDTLKNANMPYIGAGRNIEEAIKAYYFVINGYKISFLNATRAEKYILTPEAGEDTPGVFRAYDPSLLAQRIEEEKKVSDYVVALLHWGKEDSHELESVILNDAKLYIDSGADLIVGSHAHELQGMEFYKDKLIAYNLGDFLFSRVSDYTGILTLNLSFDGNMSYKFVPAYQNNFKTTMIYESDAKDLYSLMKKWSINVEMDDSGNIIKLEN